MNLVANQQSWGENALHEKGEESEEPLQNPIIQNADNNFSKSLQLLKNNKK